MILTNYLNSNRCLRSSKSLKGSFDQAYCFQAKYTEPFKPMTASL